MLNLVKRISLANKPLKKVVGIIKGAERGGCYVMYFIVTDTGGKCYNRNHGFRQGSMVINQKWRRCCFEKGKKRNCQ